MGSCRGLIWGYVDVSRDKSSDKDRVSSNKGLLPLWDVTHQKNHGRHDKSQRDKSDIDFSSF